MSLLSILLLLSIFGLVWLRSSYVSVEYRIGAMETQKAEALKEKKALAAELAALLSLDEVEQRDISLVFPDRQKVIYVKRDGGGVPYSAALTRN
jgi:hypothetical protein